MAAFLQKMRFNRSLRLAHRCYEAQAVLDGHGVIIVRVHDESGWRADTDVPFRRTPLDFGIAGGLTQ